MKIKTFFFIVICVSISVLCGIVAARWNLARQEALANLTIREPLEVVSFYGEAARV